MAKAYRGEEFPLPAGYSFPDMSPGEWGKPPRGEPKKFRPQHFKAWWKNDGQWLFQVSIWGKEVIQKGKALGLRDLDFVWEGLLRDGGVDLDTVHPAIAEAVRKHATANGLSAGRSHASGAEKTRHGKKPSPGSRPPKWERDELILACDLVYRNGWTGLTESDPLVRELSELLQKRSHHPIEVRGEKFRNPSGVARTTSDLAAQHPDYKGKETKGGALDRSVVQDFLVDGPGMHRIAEAIREGTASADELDPMLDDADDPEGTTREGRLKVRKHYARERNPKVRNGKIREHKRVHGRLFCMICGFDFENVYGEHGRDYIECHHIIPLSESGETDTNLDNLILVCANCHRMIHRQKPWLKPEKLREKISVAKD